MPEKLIVVGRVDEKLDGETAVRLATERLGDTPRSDAPTPPVRDSLGSTPAVLALIALIGPKAETEIASVLATDLDGFGADSSLNVPITET